MKPQLTNLDGIHNSNISAAQSRLIRGASWKKQRIIVVIPAGDMIPAKVALSHWALGFPPNNPVVRLLAQGMEVGEAYSSAIANILNDVNLREWEYILTIEHDNIPPSDGVIKLLTQMEAHPEFSCIGGLYFTKGYEGVAQIWGDPKDPILNFRPQIPQTDKLIECCGTGMGFNLWRLSMFKDKKLSQPFFKTIAGKDGFATQDLHAWSEFRKYGYRCAIDCSVKVGHYDVENDIVW